MMDRSILSVIFTFLVLLGHGQNSTGTEHWVTFMENLDLQFNAPPSFHLVVSSENDAVGQVEFPSTGFTIPFTIPSGTDVVFDLPTNNYHAFGDEAVFDHGMKVTSNVPVSVYAYHDRLYFSEASLILPRSMLGSSYMVLAREDDRAFYPSEFAVLATADDTEVEITPSVLTVGFRPPGIPFTVTLDAGQSVQVQAFEDISGTIVRSTDPAKLIAVFAGAQQAIVNCGGGGADDHLYNQVFPTEMWGQDFMIVPYLGRNGDQVRVLASEDGTQVTIGSSVYFLDAGELFTFDANGPIRIQADNPVAVGQFNDSQTCNGATGDPAYLFVPPLDHTDNRCLWNARNSDGTPEHFVNIICTGTVAVDAIYLDGVDISSFFQQVPDVVGYWYLQRSISEGSHELIAAKTFQAVAYGFGDFNSCTYSLGFENQFTIGINELPSVEPGTQIINSGEDWLHTWPAVGREELLIMDLSGRSVIRHDLWTDAVVPTAMLNPGIYIYERSVRGERISTGRIVVR